MKNTTHLLFICVLILPKIALSNESTFDKTRIRMNFIKNALQAYHLDAKAYPSNEQGLEALVHKPSLFPTAHYPSGGYIEKIPTDGWNHEFHYENNHKNFKITSAGPDGVFNTEDDIFRSSSEHGTSN